MSTNPISPAIAAKPQQQPLQFTQLTKTDLDDPSLGLLNTLLTQMQTQIAAFGGAGGPAPLAGGVDVKGNTVKNIGPPTEHGDAVSLGHAERNYSAQALAPQLESGKTQLKSYRAIDSKTQTESYSNFLENVMNTVPTANTSTLSAAPPGGGSVAVTISAGYHVFPSGKTVTYGMRTDTLSLPATFSISSISRTGDEVTAIMSGATGFLAGQQIFVTGVSDNSYNGTFALDTSTGGGATLKWPQVGGNSSSSGGTASENGCYYYFIGVNSNMLALAGPFSSDIQSNRVNVNQDGFVLIAVIVLNSSGFDFSQSAAGATPPAATGNSRLLLRL